MDTDSVQDEIDVDAMQIDDYDQLGPIYLNRWIDCQDTYDPPRWYALYI